MFARKKSLLFKNMLKRWNNFLLIIFWANALIICIPSSLGTKTANWPELSSGLIDQKSLQTERYRFAPAPKLVVCKPKHWKTNDWQINVSTQQHYRLTWSDVLKTSIPISPGYRAFQWLHILCLWIQQSTTPKSGFKKCVTLNQLLVANDCFSVALGSAL